MTTTSAGTSSPERSSTPFDVNRSITPVTIEACAGPDGGEEVAVRDDAQALVPRVVRRGEVCLEVEVGRQLAEQAATHKRLHRRRRAPAQLVARGHHQHVLPADQIVGRRAGNRLRSRSASGSREGRLMM